MGEDRRPPPPGAMDETPFGEKYVLVRHLATGGMAELFLARQTGLAGFQKDIVIKRIQSRYVDHTRIVRMFIDEARIAASLNHPNIVHIYDIGQQDGTWYIAMEYIQGENLWSVARRGIETKNFLPLEHAIKVVSMVCEGLEYAHARADTQGRPLRIVHRDISPSNILLTYEGVAKIVDFGIARAENQIREEKGLVAGKCHYMAPEALRGDKLDHRADIWSVGVVLWEMTLGRRLYKGKADEAASQVLDQPVPPPTFVRRDYPPALEQIVLRALEKHPDERYGSAGQMMQDLEDFLAEAGLRTSSLRIGRYLKELFARPVAAASPEDARRAAEFGEAVDARSGSAPAGRPGQEDEADELDFDRRPAPPPPATPAPRTGSVRTPLPGAAPIGPAGTGTGPGRATPGFGTPTPSSAPALRTPAPRPGTPSPRAVTPGSAPRIPVPTGRPPSAPNGRAPETPSASPAASADGGGPSAAVPEESLILASRLESPDEGPPTPVPLPPVLEPPPAATAGSGAGAWPWPLDGGAEVILARAPETLADPDPAGAAAPDEALGESGAAAEGPPGSEAVPFGLLRAERKAGPWPVFVGVCVLALASALGLALCSRKAHSSPPFDPRPATVIPFSR